MANYQLSKAEKNANAYRMGLEVAFAVACVASLYMIYVYGRELSEAKREELKEDLIVKIVTYVIAALGSLIAVIGIMRESKVIIVLILVIILVSSGFAIYNEQYWILLYTIIIGLLTGLFLYFLVKKESATQETA